MKVKAKLNSRSLNAAIKKLEKYSEKLDTFAEELRRELAQRIAEIAERRFDTALYDKLIGEGWQKPNVRISVSEDNNVTVVLADGEDAVFIEFGAGVYWNPNGAPHPNRETAGVVNIGEYGKGRGKRKAWGFMDESGEFHMTHGTPMAMPMYSAARDIARQLPEIAKEVYKKVVSNR